MQKMWLLTINYQKTFKDFRVLVLDDNAFLVDVHAPGWTEFSRLARGIRDIGRHNFLTKNVKQPGTDASHGLTLGELNVQLMDYDTSGKAWLHHSFFGFKSPDCDHLKASRLYPILNDYITHAGVSTRGTIFG